MNSEKDELLKTIKEFEKKYKDLQVKYDANEQSWTRLKTDMSDKQRKVNHYSFYFIYYKDHFFFVLFSMMKVLN
jgi:hypothetical protein